MPRNKAPHFSSPARADLRRATFWYEEQRQGLGEEFARTVRKVIATIAAAPERWPVKRGTRRFVFRRRFPFTIAYRIENGVVEIVAVAHHKRDPASWQDR